MAAGGRRSGRSRGTLTLIVAAVVIGLTATGLFPALRESLWLLVSIRPEHAFEAASQADRPQAELVAEIRAILDDPAILPADLPVLSVTHEIDGCDLVRRVRNAPSLCEAAADPDAGPRIERVEERVDLRDLVTHPAYVAERGAVFPTRGGGLREAVAWPWVPAVRAEALSAERAMILIDPQRFTEARPQLRADAATSIAEDVLDGALGPAVQRNHRRVRFCTGREAVVPLPEPYAMYVAPDRRDALIDLIHALGATRCVGRFWLASP